ncbi:hypothetical protein D9611_014215 [Ephemerocybe angulata]|uniref:Uncharacterized protein n=1 Tax=Ephemerocybe angulata TaxID=980116 RepID=A0A8H5CBA3_9AGAR|nr:hypothetical protein D9611_014215 [Tulosesus angulatus]
MQLLWAVFPPSSTSSTAPSRPLCSHLHASQRLPSCADRSDWLPGPVFDARLRGSAALIRCAAPSCSTASTPDPSSLLSPPTVPPSLAHCRRAATLHNDIPDLRLTGIATPAKFYFDTGQPLISIVRAVPERPTPGFQVSWRDDRLAAAHVDAPFNRLTPTLPAHARTPKHKCIGRLDQSLAFERSRHPSPGAPSFGAFRTRAAPRATASTGTARTERNTRLRDNKTAQSDCSQIPTSSKHTHEYIGSRRQSTRPCAAPQHEQHLAQLRTRAENRRKRESACVGWGCASERIWMRTSGYCRAQGEANIATSRRGANQDSRVCLALCRARPSRTRHPERRWANWLLRHRRCTTDDVEGGDGRLEQRRMEWLNHNRSYSTSDDGGDGIRGGAKSSDEDATDKVTDNHETAKTTITTTVPIRGWFAGGTETDRVWHSSISRHSFKLPSTCSAAGSPCVVLRARA